MAAGVGRLLGILLVLTGLVGCTSFPTQPPNLAERKTVRVVQSMQYPELPDIQVPVLNLLPVQHDAPRDPDADLMVKNSRSCKKVPEKEQNSKFWERCGSQPPMLNSNLHRGYDLDNWTNLWVNDARIQEYIIILKGKIHEVNRRRAKWRELAEQERERQRKIQEQADAAEAPPPAQEK